MTKIRLDLLLVERGLFPTRTKAQAALMAGKVRVPGRDLPKPGDLVMRDALVEVLPDACPYVSRGGLKLAGALNAFKLDVAGKIAVDLGASTGGFTDCLLKRGVVKVYAVDVGHGQLDASLRADRRVVNLERTHARDLAPDSFSPRPTLAVIDVSFISLTMVLKPLLACLERPADVVALVKPQFELEPKKTPDGIVKDEAHRQEALARVRDAAIALGLRERACIDSPLAGAKGNLEFLVHWGLSALR